MFLYSSKRDFIVRSSRENLFVHNEAKDRSNDSHLSSHGLGDNSMIAFYLICIFQNPISNVLLTPFFIVIASTVKIKVLPILKEV